MPKRPAGLLFGNLSNLTFVSKKKTFGCFFYFCCGRSRSGSVLTVREAVEKRAKSMKPFGFTNEANHGRNKKTERNTETATTRKSLQPDLRFASTKKGETTHNGSHTKKTTQIHGDCLRHDEISPPCLRNMHKRINSLWPKQINRGWEAKQLWKAATRLLKATVHNGCHLRVLSGVLCPSSNRLVSFKGSGSCHKAWVYSPWVVAKKKRSVVCLFVLDKTRKHVLFQNQAQTSFTACSHHHRRNKICTRCQYHNVMERSFSPSQ